MPKGKVKRPLCIGVPITGGKWTWHYGPDLAAALTAALIALEGKPP